MGGGRYIGEWGVTGFSMGVGGILLGESFLIVQNLDCSGLL